MTKHHLTDAEKSRGHRGSALVRSAQRQAFLWEVRGHLIELARSGALSSTLRERANQLNERGVRTTTGKIVNEKNLSSALKMLGVHTSKINALRHAAKKAAHNFEVDQSEMFDQMWHEWLYHHTRIMIDHGINFTGGSEHDFFFKPMHPFTWDKKGRPEDRDHRVRLWWWGKRKILPQQAQLVFALFGMFGFQKNAVRRNGAALRVVQP